MTITLKCQALLFDLDGTLIDSMSAVDRAWRRFSLRHGLDPDEILPKIHGRRSLDSIRSLLPHVDAEAEDAFIRHIEATDTEGVVPLAGAQQFLASLPQDRWGIVTSGSTAVANARISAGGLPIPKIFVVGDDVQRGKPAPDPYLLGAKLLGFPPEECIGFEDAPAGLKSLEAAGMPAIAVNVPGFAISISDYRKIRAEFDGTALSLLLEQA